MKSLQNKMFFGGGKVKVDTLKSGLVACIEMNETSGTTAFDSYSSNNFINTNTLINQTGLIDKSYYFNGTNATLENLSSIGAILSVGSIVTISIWYNSTNFAGTILQYGTSVNVPPYNFYIRTSTTGKVFAAVYTNYYTQVYSNIITNDGNWHNCIIEIDLSIASALNKIKLYIDNEEDSDYPIQGALNTGNLANTKIKVGGRTSSVDLFKGNLEQLSVWNRKLTENEKTAIYNNGDGLAFDNW